MAFCERQSLPEGLPAWIGGCVNLNEHIAFSITRIAQRLDVSERTARRIVEIGELKAHRIGRQWRVFETDLQDYLARNANSQERFGADGGHSGVQA
jgi:excisionase family DNA binding protein